MLINTFSEWTVYRIHSIKSNRAQELKL
uniref:Uncharacterized protein n=1 Tax=Anguilla anguilla TaxID=7936 RepID=A0A0E9VJH5_ANGAN